MQPGWVSDGCDAQVRHHAPSRGHFPQAPQACHDGYSTCPFVTSATCLDLASWRYSHAHHLIRPLHPQLGVSHGLLRPPSATSSWSPPLPRHCQVDCRSVGTLLVLRTGCCPPIAHSLQTWQKCCMASALQVPPHDLVAQLLHDAHLAWCGGRLGRVEALLGGSLHCVIGLERLVQHQVQALRGAVHVVVSVSQPGGPRGHGIVQLPAPLAGV
mmetsp:Transcript_7244/g.15803  ORF Transcript_7244/g.15803 Transcript_7244/m.15803 type:complete len:213 (-) Transcript_7244:1115-1753(-)